MADPSFAYEERGIIGKGAFGDVYLVVDKATRVKYVMKKIKMARQNDWQRESTRREIEIISKLDHPFIMPYKEHWLHHGHTISVVYGYCEKGDLQAAVARQRGKAFGEAQLRLWLAELLFALHYMHGEGVLHRDIKAGNILLTADGDVQLGDFGLATIRHPTDDSKHDHALVGTPHYMSPELVSSMKYGFETDIWSLGCVMYELSTLKPPFNAFNLPGLVAKIKRAALPPVPSSYTPEWANLIKGMLRKDPTRRLNTLELLGCPSMREAVEQARGRAAAIRPEVALPDVPVSLAVGGFAFDAAGTPLGQSATPSFGGAAEEATPELVQGQGHQQQPVEPCAGLADGPTDGEASPLPAFPDLDAAAAASPLAPRQAPSRPGTGGGAAAPAAKAARTLQPAAATASKAAAASTGGAASAVGSTAHYRPLRKAPLPPEAKQKTSPAPAASVTSTRAVKRGADPLAPGTHAAKQPARMSGPDVTPRAADQGQAAAASAAPNANGQSVPQPASAPGTPSASTSTAAAAGAVAAAVAAPRSQRGGSTAGISAAQAAARPQAAQPASTVGTAGAVRRNPAYAGSVAGTAPYRPSAAAAGSAKSPSAAPKARYAGSVASSIAATAPLPRRPAQPAAAAPSAAAPKASTASPSAARTARAVSTAGSREDASTQAKAGIKSQRGSASSGGAPDALPRRAAVPKVAAGSSLLDRSPAVTSHPVPAHDLAGTSCDTSAGGEAVAQAADAVAAAAAATAVTAATSTAAVAVTPVDVAAVAAAAAAGERHEDIDLSGEHTPPRRLLNHTMSSSSAVIQRSMSVLTEDSELSMPSGRYTPFNVSQTGAARHSSNGADEHCFHNQLYSALSGGVSQHAMLADDAVRRISSSSMFEAGLASGQQQPQDLPQRVSASVLGIKRRSGSGAGDAADGSPDSGAAAGVAEEDSGSGSAEPTPASQRYHEPNSVRSSIDVITPAGFVPLSPTASVSARGAAAETPLGTPNTEDGGSVGGASALSSPSPLAHGQRYPHPHHAQLNAEASFGSPTLVGGLRRPFAGFDVRQPAMGSVSSAGGATGAGSSQLGEQEGPAAPSDTERERLVKLERIISLAGTLYQRGRWQELGAMLSTTQALTMPAADPRASTESLAVEWGSRVRVVGGPLHGKQATIRYQGPCHWDGGDVVGLELEGDDSAYGGDGTRDGVRYFFCRPARGAFVSPAQVAAA